MKAIRVLLVTAVLLVLASFASTVGTQQAASDASIQPFLGRWDLTLKSMDREYPSWIEINQANGQLSARFVGRWGNARPLPKIEIHGNHITFVSPKEEEGSKNDMVFDGTLMGNMLSGTTNGPEATPWTWTGGRAPLLHEAGMPKWGKPIQLFNGKDLTGWRMSAAGPPSWTVQNGNLVTPGNGPELVSAIKVQDFKLHVEFNSAPVSNSGVYLRGRYEVQIETDSVDEPPSHHTGGVYGFIAPSPELPRSPDTWQTFDITFIGRNVTVIQNGQTIIDHQDIPGITGGALNSREGEPAPIYLQGSEKGHVLFRNMILTPAEE